MLEVQICRKTNDCPFENKEIRFNISEGECLWLKGISGAGKTSIAKHLARLDTLPGADVKVYWNTEEEQKTNPVGILFQQGVLIDSLNLEENIALSCKAANKPYDKKSILKHILDVDLAEIDLYKMPGELSGGMLRRAALAQILSQEKKLIILDEPFIGLDPETIQDIVNLLNNLKNRGIAFILISHQEDYCEEFLTLGKEVKLKPRKIEPPRKRRKKLARWSQLSRILLRIGNYLGISIPLIACAFFAAGLAISMLFAQMLKETGVSSLMSQFNTEHSSLLMRFFGHEFSKLAGKYLPVIREKIYISILAKGFVIEMGPLLTALLLAGRIGGSYAGEVGMMQATNQNNLLKTLGKSPRAWSLFPTAVSAIIAAPILTLIGTGVALVVGGWVGMWETFGLIPTSAAYWGGIYSRVFVVEGGIWGFPVLVNIYRSIGFMIIIIGIAELSGRFRKNLQPRDVPQSITWAIVIASLLIIVADWGFSQLIHL